MIPHREQLVSLFDFLTSFPRFRCGLILWGLSLSHQSAVYHRWYDPQRIMHLHRTIGMQY